MIDYSFHPDAEAEFAQAVQFYESHARGLGAFFISEIERTLFIVRRFPQAGMPDAANQILVVAVAHQRRRPGLLAPASLTRG